MAPNDVQNGREMNSEKQSESANRAKKALRSSAISRRSGLSVDSESVCSSLEPFLAAFMADKDGVVVVYDGLEGEVNLSQLWEPTLTQTDPAISYAITRTPESGRVLSVHPVSAQLERHRWGYRQPVAGSDVVEDDDVAAVLVPALAFDLHGGRLGWGAGYYDRLLSRLSAPTLRIGISDGYIVDEVPTEPHDVPMTHIATPTGVITV